MKNLFKRMTSTKLLVLTALFLVVFDNLAFFRNVLKVYPLTLHNLAFLVSTAVVLTAITVFFLVLLCSRLTLKPVLIVMLLVASLTGYFTNTYNTIIDAGMIQNAVQSGFGEARELFSWPLLAAFLVLGVAPSVAVFLARVEYGSFKKELLNRLRLGGVALLLMLLPLLGLAQFYAPFFREHKVLRYYCNPLTAFYSLGKYTRHRLNSDSEAVTVIPAGDLDRELIVLVVGEAARADRFSLNGYARETNPRLAREEIVNFREMHACGTATPCQFSLFGGEDFTDPKGNSPRNILDVLSRAGVHLLWRDNNPDIKGGGLRVKYEDYQDPRINPVCDAECRDEGMLVGLQEYIDSRKDGDILIVLHQMGNHGPAYYKRYPAAFEKFVPVCRSNKLEGCSQAEIDNAYDNAILYTDFFLAEVIKLLKRNDSFFETAMFYLSDHGESIGEDSMYRQGLPYATAPDPQTRIGAVIWVGKKFKADRQALRAEAARPWSQDNLFHTLLGILEVDAAVYDRGKDLFK